MTRETKVIGLPDGRDLAWHDIGSEQDTPVVAFHGSPGTGAEFAKFEATAAGYRIIAPDRPGYGHSTYDPRRSFVSWIDDVALLADHLELDQFAVVGVSSGGPNAAACARFRPDRVIGCAIVSGPAPPDASISDEEMLAANRIGRRLLRLAPRLGSRVMSPLSTLALRAAQRNPERAIAYLERSLPPVDAAVIGREGVKAALLQDFSKPMSTTAGRAAVQDFVLEVSDWGFRLEDVAGHVHIWHGDQDRNVPVVNGVRQADAIPSSTLHRIADAGHWLIYDHLAEILRRISS